jgi:hypothetical protein
MSCSTVMFSLFLVSPCTQGVSVDVNETVAAAVSNPQRPAEEIVKDTVRKPARVLYSDPTSEPTSLGGKIKAAPATSNKSNRQLRAGG